MISPTEILQGNILIVDDKKSTVLLLERMLRGAGYVSITSTMNPNEVCDLHRKNNYDLILLDLQMPDLDGFQVLKELKKIEAHGHLPVIVITAHSDHKIQAFQAGAMDFISKPFELAEVLARVHNVLEAHLSKVATDRQIDLLNQKIQQGEAHSDSMLQQKDELSRP